MHIKLSSEAQEKMHTTIPKDDFYVKSVVQKEKKDLGLKIVFL